MVDLLPAPEEPPAWPTPLPIIRNMLQLGFQPHETFAELSKQYGSLISIHLGNLVWPIMPLANRILHTVPTTLVHNFDWKLERPDASDDEAKGVFCGFSVRRAVSLKIIPYKKA
ncbi:hypothetical protein SASPL_149081 [Salvia splendens]|uniref:Uncharacterized protein n=1 Tax=Salvia splendens TaxID=180675 RepID=A0A8X8WAJ0_SALSN|nr:hypothetical protein SASPL_149081 [Salvia splendens]